MAVIDIFIVSVLVFLIAVFIGGKTGVVFGFKKAGLLLVFSFLLNIFSLFIATERVGGTVLYESRGWPHFYYIFQIKDVLDNVPIDIGNFVFGSFWSYPVSNTIFYFSLLFLFIVFFRVLRK